MTEPGMVVLCDGTEPGMDDVDPVPVAMDIVELPYGAVGTDIVLLEDMLSVELVMPLYEVTDPGIEELAEPVVRMIDVDAVPVAMEDVEPVPIAMDDVELPCGAVEIEPEATLLVELVVALRQGVYVAGNVVGGSTVVEELPYGAEDSEVVIIVDEAPVAPVDIGAVVRGTLCVEAAVVVLLYGADISLVLERMTEEALVPEGAVLSGTETVVVVLP